MRKCRCPRCKREITLKRLPPNFKCADIICDFCGYLAQVKAVTSANISEIPNKVLGAAWRHQRDRMDAAIYFPLFLVMVVGKESAIYYLSAGLQKPSMFLSRKPLSATARRAGWQGFLYDLVPVKNSLVRIT